MVWEKVAKFESGALYAEMYLRQKTRTEEIEKKEREDTGREAEASPSPNCDRSKDEMEEDSTEEKRSARMTKQIDETMK